MIMNMTIGELLKQKDLKLSDQLVLVVANKEEQKKYLNVLDTNNVPFNDIIISGIGGHRATNKAIDYFPEGEPLIFMDDDIKNIKHWTNMKENEIESCNILGQYYNKIFDILASGKTPATSFTVDYTSNWLFKVKKPFMETRPRRLGGVWWGGYNQEEFFTSHAHEDDNLRTSQVLDKDGVSLSVNWLAATTNYGKTRGGMQSSGDRGIDESGRLSETKESCLSALESPQVAKYFESEPVLNKQAGVYTLKMKNQHELKRMRAYDHLKWNDYFQDNPEGTLLDFLP